MLAADVVARSLERDWGLAEASLVAHGGGMNSQAWVVSAGARRWVAKAVGAGAARELKGGLAVASMVQAAGIPAGAAVPTRDGRSTSQSMDTSSRCSRSSRAPSSPATTNTNSARSE